MAQYPDYYEAFMGIGQVVNQFESEKSGYANMVQRAQQDNDRNAIDKLVKHTLNTPQDATMKYLMLRSQIMNQQGNELCGTATK